MGDSHSLIVVIDLMMNSTYHTDIAIVGAGPMGCATALTFAKKGENVVVLEANPNNSKKLGGEWIHPLGVQILEQLGFDSIRSVASKYSNGKGFVIFPDDGTTPIKLFYPQSQSGLSCEHRLLVKILRERALSHPNVMFIPFARVIEINKQCLTINMYNDRNIKVSAKRIIGADGRASMVRKALNNSKIYCNQSGTSKKVISYMAGICISDVELPFEGFGHLILGGPGPITIYRIGSNQVRILLDVPVHKFKELKEKTTYLRYAYSPFIPKVLLSSFEKSLSTQTVVWSANQTSSGSIYGNENLTLVGDAAGFHHPLTATGMTLGFKDVECLGRSENFKTFKHERITNTIVPGLLASLLYGVFAQKDKGALSIRQSIYKMWRNNPTDCHQTMLLLSGSQTRIIPFARSFLRVIWIAIIQTLNFTFAKGDWIYLLETFGSLIVWVRLFFKLCFSRITFHKVESFYLYWKFLKHHQ